MKATDTINNVAATEKPVVVAHPRPFQTYYYKTHKDDVTQWQRTSRSCTVHGALRAAFLRLFNGVSGHADIYDINGIRVAYITRRGNRYTIVCV